MATAPSITSFSGNYRFLSNFWPCGVESLTTGIVYPSSEHAYQAAKTTDLELRKKFAALRTAAESKALGSAIHIRPDWERVKFRVMLSVLRAKFTQNPDLAKLLVATGEAVLVEGNHWGDTCWGVCNGVGENHLGLLLMKVREEL